MTAGPRRRLFGPRLASFWLGAALLVSGCATSSGDAGSRGISHPSDGRTLVLRVETSGGFIAPGASFSIVPEFSLFGDGTVVLQGPEPAIYPGPALHNVRTSHVDEAGVQAILRAARAAGLMRLHGLVGGPGMPDVGATTVTLIAGGKRHVVTVGDPTGGLLPRGPAAGLNALRRKLQDLRPWLPRGAVGPQSSFVPGALAVLASPRQATSPSGLKEPGIEWPLPQPLDTFGHPFGPSSGSGCRCGVVSGSQLSVLLSAAYHATEITPWRSGGAGYSLAFRPVLPDGWGGCLT